MIVRVNILFFPHPAKFTILALLQHYDYLINKISSATSQWYFRANYNSRVIARHSGNSLKVQSLSQSKKY